MTILLDRDEDLQKVESEIKNKFIFETLSQIGLDLSFWKVPEVLSVNEKIKLRELLFSQNIEIIDSSGEGIKIKIKGVLAGFLKKPIYRLKRDISTSDSKKRIYLEMSLEEPWTLFKRE